MTTQEFRRWLKGTIAELNRLDTAPDLPFHIFEEAAEVVRQAGRHAALLGIASRCGDCTTDALALPEARSLLAECLAAVDAREKPDILMVAQVAKTLGVNRGQVLTWIRSGELRASNTGKGSLLPRWRIARADLDAFLAGRQPTPATPRKRRERQTAEYIRFYPES